MKQNTEQGTPLNLETGYTGTDVPVDPDLYRCVHCGLCLSACPTYTELGLETESPRGRIALMKAVKEGRLGISDRVASHWELCLQCRACEAVCPSGVPFGRIMEYSRHQLHLHGKGSLKQKLVSSLFLKAALPHPRRLRAGAALLRLYQRSGLQKLVRTTGLLRLLPGKVAEMEQGLPSFSQRFFGPSPTPYPAQGTRRAVVGLLSGCVMPLVQGPTMEATVRVLTRNGCDVLVPPGQGCCGALNRHSGDMETARKLARTNMDIFLKAGVERVVVASAGCGSAMKEYGELLKDDPDYHELAERFGAMTMDVTEFLAELPLVPPRGRVSRKVTYQDPCHLAHAQRITAAPRTILRSIPGLELVELEDGGKCCGAAGIYSLTHRQMSRQLLGSKMKAVAATGAEDVATANPGCMVQLEAGFRELKKPGMVYHVVDLLDQAYQKEG